MKNLVLAILIASTALCRTAGAAPAWCPGSTGDGQNEVPCYEHIFLIIAENHAYGQIIGNPKAPNINRLAKSYGSATQFYGEVHPSKANYIAMLGGDTFGIHDDDAFYCRAGSTDRYCEKAEKIAPYVDHTVTARARRKGRLPSRSATPRRRPAQRSLCIEAQRLHPVSLGAERSGAREQDRWFRPAVPGSRAWPGSQLCPHRAEQRQRDARARRPQLSARLPLRQRRRPHRARRQGDRQTGGKDPGLADLEGSPQHRHRGHLGRGRRSGREEGNPGLLRF